MDKNATRRKGKSYGKVKTVHIYQRINNIDERQTVLFGKDLLLKRNIPDQFSDHLLRKRIDLKTEERKERTNGKAAVFFFECIILKQRTIGFFSLYDGSVHCLLQLSYEMTDYGV